MSLPYDTLNTVNKQLMQDVPGIENIGLLNGKMGVSIYFFYLARETENNVHQEFAEALIDEIYEKVSNNEVFLDFENGLAGIAWGIEHLVQNGFVDANTDAILSDVDDKIYQHLINTEELPIGPLSGVLGYMLYVTSRLKGKNLNAENTTTYIFKRLLIDLINRLSTALGEKESMIREPKLFTITWNLPLILILLGQCHAMQIHTSKIERILEQLTPLVQSLYPHLMSHRLYFLYGLKCILKQVSLPQWRSHADFLKKNLHLPDILDHELKNKNISFEHGCAGIASISRRLYEITSNPSLLLSNDRLIKKITTSEYWQLIKNDKSERENVGFLSGLTGIAMELLELRKEQSAEVEFR